MLRKKKSKISSGVFNGKFNGNYFIIFFKKRKV